MLSFSVLISLQNVKHFLLVILFLHTSDFTEEMIFPVALGERDKDCGRTFYNNTNAYHAGEITSTHTKEKALPRFILYGRMSCWTEILAPFCPHSISSRVFEMYCKPDKRNTSLIAQKWNSYIMCLTTQPAVLFLHRLWNRSIHLQE